MTCSASSRPLTIGRRPDPARPVRNGPNQRRLRKATPGLDRAERSLRRLPSVAICPLTSLVRRDADLFRLDVAPDADNGLRALSQIAVDKITVVPVAKIGRVIGRADDALLRRVNRALVLFLGIA